MGHRDRRVFDHVLVVMFENQYRGYVLGNPYMRRLARAGRQLGSCFGVMHPSQTNYIASIAGSLCGVTNDGPVPLLDDRTIVDLLEEAPGRLRWRAYMESYVSGATPWTPTFTPGDAPPYVVKHNPFASFSSIVRDEDRWRNIDGEAALFADLLAGDLPEYAWFTPNLWSDGHWVTGTDEESTPRAPGLVDQAATWLEGFFDRLRFPGADSLLPPGTMVVVTFDESDFEADYLPHQASPYDGPNQIYTVLLGDEIEPGFEEEGYNHYSLLRTIEENFGLGHLGRNDAEANWYQFLWGRRFAWGEPEPAALGDHAAATTPIAATQHAGALWAATVADDGTVLVQAQAAGSTRWTTPEAVPVDGSGGIALASTLTELVVAAVDSEGTLRTVRYDVQQGWADPEVTLDGAVVTCALTDLATGSQLMLAARHATGEAVTRVWAEGGWGDPVPVPAAPATGPIALGRLGPSVLLLAVADDGAVLALSYNTAPYNVVAVPPNPYGGPQDDTTVAAWSPCTFPVAHFSSRPDGAGARRPEARAYRTTGPLALATLDGVVHLVHPGPGNPLLLTETFSLSGLLTPANPVSYKDYEDTDSSNGFGTMAEAGWTHQVALVGSACGPGGALAVARVGDEIVLLHRAGPGDPVLARRGRYRERTQDRSDTPWETR